ncbi:MAG: alpha/beta hydrolase [Mesorhizobium sp.]
MSRLAGGAAFRVALLLATALAVLASHAMAADLPVPSQAEWAGAKKTVTLGNGVTIAYVETGDSEGPPLLLLHGQGDTSRSWSLMAPFLPKRRLMAVDLRGHGSSSAPACCYGLQDLADDAGLFLEALGVLKVDVAGHGFGAVAAQLLAAEHPEKVGALVLVSATTAVEGGPGSPRWDAVMGLAEPVDPAGPFMKERVAVQNPVDEAFLSQVRTEGAAVPLEVWQGMQWGAATGDVGPVAGAVKAPVMVLWGEMDQVFDLPHQEKLERAYPEAEFQVFANAGHRLLWEFPEKSAKLIDEFLGAQP